MSGNLTDSPGARQDPRPVPRPVPTPDPARPGFGKRAYRGVEPYTDLVWLGWSSRDSYDGTIFGLATTWKYVDAPAVRNRVAGLVARIADRLIQDEWRILDGKGHVTRSTPTFQLAQMRAFLSICPQRFAPCDPRPVKHDVRTRRRPARPLRRLVR